MPSIDNKLWKSLSLLTQYIEKQEFKGYDPYDGLNTPIIRTFLINNKYVRIAITQGMRRLPINIRPLLGIHKGLNPKGLGLILTGYVKLLATTGEEIYRQKIEYIADILKKIQSTGYSGCCWGYNFPWQNRNQLFPVFNPTIVNTSFISHGFLDAYELLKDVKFLEIAKSACNFILNDLKITYESEDELCLSYTPLDNEKVYNANLLGASILVRVYSYTGDEKLLTQAKKMVKYVMNAQRGDGSWYYGANENQNWIDIHHTGFVIESLYDYQNITGDVTYLTNLQRGLQYFEKTFFYHNGRPKLWRNRKHPTDIHSVQAIIVLVKLQSINDNHQLLEKLVTWIIDNFQDQSGYFYYQKTKYFTNKISYMRWSQAWAFHALTTYFKYLKRKLN